MCNIPTTLCFTQFHYLPEDSRVESICLHAVGRCKRLLLTGVLHILVLAPLRKNGEGSPAAELKKKLCSRFLLIW